MTKAYVVYYYDNECCCSSLIDKVFTIPEQAEAYLKKQEEKTGLIYEYKEIEIW